MNVFKKILTGAMALSVALAVSMAGGGSRAAAAVACYNYNPSGQSQTSQTPVFNNFCNAPYGVGNEADFVRVRENSNGVVTDNANNPAYTDTVASACDAGQKFDVWNYVHNNASQEFNNNGSGSAVARNVQLALSAPLNTENSSFTFGANVSASNAASVSDTATLTCNNGKKVKLTLVPNTVRIYSKQYGAWKSLGDNSVNGTTQLGSPAMGSGDVYGCWDYRIVVVYQVTVTEVPPVQKVNASCDLLSLAAIDTRRFKVSDFKYTATNVNFSKAVIDWGDGTRTGDLKSREEVLAQTHEYAQSDTDKSYTAYVLVTFSNGATEGGPNTACAVQVNLKKGNLPPVVTTVVTTPPSQPVTRLVNTGPGSVLAMFAGVTVAGALAHRWLTARRLKG